MLDLEVDRHLLAEVLSGAQEGIYQYNKKASVTSRADVGVVRAFRPSQAL